MQSARPTPHLPDPNAVFGLLAWGENVLTRAGVSSPRVDAEWMLVHLLGGGRADLALRAREKLPAAQVRAFQNFIAARARRIPMQHILGETEFYGLPLCATPDALIPRPDTETLVSCALHALAGIFAPWVLDIGTGAGAVAVAIAHERPDAQLVATDISRQALHLASCNARKNGVANRVRFVRADRLSGLSEAPVFHAILSNPPYIPTPDLAALEPEVREHDPRLALDGGPDGLCFFRALIPAAAARLLPNGVLAFEMGADQAEPLCALMQAQPQLGAPEISRDLSGLPRVVQTRRRA